DGTMARRDDLLRFAHRHKLKIGTVADLIRYRLAKEESVEQIAERNVQTPFGPFRMVCFEGHVNRAGRLALVRGDIDPATPTLVRVHRQDTLGDVLRVQDPSLHRPLHDAMQLVDAEGAGVIVVLRLEETARDLMHAVRALGTQPGESADNRAAGRAALRPPQNPMDLRTFGTGAQILRALGVKRMRVLSAPKHMHALSGFGLEVVEYVNETNNRGGRDG